MDIPADLVAMFFAVPLILTDLFFIIYKRKLKTRRWFVASGLISFMAILLMLLTVPFFHAHDNCQLYYSCQGICPAISSEGVPCFRPVDIVYPLLVVISTVIAIIGLIKTKK